MNHTVVGLFPENAQAQRAVERLQEMGVSSKYIDVARRRDQGTDVKNEPGENHEWVGTDKIGDNNLIRFFKSLFSDKDDDLPSRYSRVASGGHAIVTVLALSREEAERVADILDESGAINVDEQVSNTGRPAGVDTAIQTERQPTMPSSNVSQEGVTGNTDAEGRRRYSQIVDRQIEDQYRLRDDNQMRGVDPGLKSDRPDASRM